MQTISNIAENIKQRTPNQKKDNRKKNKQAVYTLRDPQNDTVLYVGRTNDLERRRREHKNSLDPLKKDLRFHYEAKNLSYAQARGMEELLIQKYNTIEEGLNKIHGISTINPFFDSYIEAAVDYMYVERKVAKCPWD